MCLHRTLLCNFAQRKCHPLQLTIGNLEARDQWKDGGTHIVGYFPILEGGLLVYFHVSDIHVIAGSAKNQHLPHLRMQLYHNCVSAFVRAWKPGEETGFVLPNYKGDLELYYSPITLWKGDLVELRKLATKKTTFDASALQPCTACTVCIVLVGCARQ